ncbi:hypothetical protein [Nonomuraea endophytica]|uniref:hypothetical protein n=1 Tax=Nonomuraea endophytica TaxID=714136 RepID=UPI0037CBB8C3
MASIDNSWSLEQSWPGLVADRDGVEYSAEELGKVAAALWAKFPEIHGSDPTGRQSTGLPLQGSCPDVEAHREALAAFATPLERMRNWSGGATFAAALKQSHAELTKVYTEVNAKLEIAFTLIEVGAGHYKDANAANGA